MSLLLGAIADDFTGATDLASTLVGEGMRVVQIIGAPSEDVGAGDAEAVVIALKSRTAPAPEAVEASLRALSWLRARGARQIVFKYCSTFDSTPRGNIGPVADALLDGLGADFAFVCPAFPENGRTIYMGHLFVGDRLLSESSMKDHPLTPMRESDLVRLMAAQSLRPVGLVPLQTVRTGPEAIRARIAELRAAGVAYGVADALTDDDLRRIGQAARDHALVTGGSGVAMGLPANLRAAGLLQAARPPAYPRASGRELVLSGSCSTATRAQIARSLGRWPARKLDVDALAAGEDVVGALTRWARDQRADAPVVLYASADPEEVARNQARHGASRAGQLIEDALGRIAERLRAAGFDRIIVAGGETAGAVVSALGVRALRIGPAITAGVPWTGAVGSPPLALALKSGNFGGESFFEDAFSVLP